MKLLFVNIDGHVYSVSYEHVDQNGWHNITFLCKLAFTLMRDPESESGRWHC